jgi:uncharacterized membrane protein
MAIIKLLHVLFLFVWIGTFLTLPLQLRYWVKFIPQREVSAFAKKIYFSMDFPAMVLAICLGITLLLYKQINWKAPWLHMKLTFAFVLIVCDLTTGWKLFRQDPSAFSWFRMGLGIFAFLGVLVAIYILK